MFIFHARPPLPGKKVLHAMTKNSRSQYYFGSALQSFSKSFSSQEGLPWAHKSSTQRCVLSSQICVIVWFWSCSMPMVVAVARCETSTLRWWRWGSSMHSPMSIHTGQVVAVVLVVGSAPPPRPWLCCARTYASIHSWQNKCVATGLVQPNTIITWASWQSEQVVALGSVSSTSSTIWLTLQSCCWFSLKRDPFMVISFFPYLFATA